MSHHDRIMLVLLGAPWVVVFSLMAVSLIKDRMKNGARTRT